MNALCVYRTSDVLLMFEPFSRLLLFMAVVSFCHLCDNSGIISFCSCLICKVICDRVSGHPLIILFFGSHARLDIGLSGSSYMLFPCIAAEEASHHLVVLNSLLVACFALPCGQP